MKMYSVLSVSLFILISGCVEKDMNKLDNAKTLKLIKFNLSQRPCSNIVRLNYSDAPLENKIIFNHYRIGYELLADGYEVTTPNGLKYSAVVIDHATGETLERAKILLLRMEIERLAEKGMEPAEIRRFILPLPLIPVPAYKEYSETEISTLLGLGDSVAKYWNYVVDSNADFLCSFDTNSGVESGYGVCMFVYPESEQPKYIIVAAGQHIMARLQVL